MAATNQELISRFESKFIPEPMSGCWLWATFYDPKGYGRFTIKPTYRCPMTAHRAAWIIYRGPIPDGLCVLHKCDTPACVNPDHLFLGTRSDNNHDMMRKGRNSSKVGTLNGNAKLSLKDVQAIKADRRLQREIAQDYSVCEATVGHIKSGRNWKQVPGSA